jgi:hypothetical protein
VAPVAFGTTEHNGSQRNTQKSRNNLTKSAASPDRKVRSTTDGIALHKARGLRRILVVKLSRQCNTRSEHSRFSTAPRSEQRTRQVSSVYIAASGRTHRFLSGAHSPGGMSKRKTWPTAPPPAGTAPRFDTYKRPSGPKVIPVGTESPVTTCSRTPFG